CGCQNHHGFSCRSKKKLDRSNNDLINFNHNSWFYISIIIHGFNCGRGELRLGRVSSELTSGERDEIDGNAADDKRR
ncbi:unnamed protein product, partial [Brassica rapa subsp. trilocularis]